LQDLHEATTAKIIAEAEAVSNECKDRVPRTLLALEREGKVRKIFSKEKKAILWIANVV